ncbi:MAG: hypothetical protein ACXWB9_06400 [Flavisolibacter sp.]
MFLNLNRLITALFLVLLAGAFYFSLERILFSDAAFILTRIINSGSLQIQEHRYGSFITQTFPLLASRLHLPLPVVVVLYSISFNLFYLGVVLLVLFRFRDQGLAILMGFYFVLFVSDTYFWTNNEVHQGIAWMFLFFAISTWLNNKRFKVYLFLPVFLLLASLSVFTHPLVVFPLCFLWVLFLLQGRWSFNWIEKIAYSLLLVMICIIKFMLSTSEAQSHYDVEKLQNATQITFESVKEALTSPLAMEILTRSFTIYWLVPLLLFAGIYSAVQQKKWMPILLTIGTLSIYFVALCITFTHFLPFYMESELMPLSIIATSLFVYYTLPLMREKYAVLILALIFFVRLVYIGFAAPAWIARKEWLMDSLDQMKEQQITKGYIYEQEVHQEQLFLTWGLPSESLLASALRGEKPQRTFIITNGEILEWKKPVLTNEIMGSFENFKAASFNPRYFQIDTSSGYVELKQ